MHENFEFDTADLPKESIQVPLLIQEGVEEVRKARHSKPKALYLFAGLKRHSDVSEYLRGLGWDISEIDILRDKSHDLSKETLRQRLLSKVQQGEYCAIIASPPCDTFSRVKYANNLGPRPSRSFLHKRGFPWLMGETKRIVEIANKLADFTFEIILAQARNFPGLVLVEFPEDLGSVKYGRWQGVRPASIWQWDAMEEVRRTPGFVELGILQSDYGANYLKPTRILLRGKPSGQHWYLGPATFDKDGYYSGPLPKQDPTKQNLITLARKPGDKGFRTSGTAAWPPNLCRWAAESLNESFLDFLASEKGGAFNSGKSKAGEKSTNPGLTDSYPVVTPPQDYWKGGSGPPRSTYALGKTSQFHDGAGLTSPGRWPPERRVLPEGTRWERLREDLFGKLLDFEEVQGTKWGKEGVQRALLKLCCSHDIEVFPEKLVMEGRVILQNWLGKQCGDYDTQEDEIPEDQPFCLKSLFYLLREMRDADYEVIRQLRNKVTAGILQPLPRTPAIFEEQTKWRLNLNPFVDPAHVAGNYASLEEHKEKVKAQFKEEEEAGLMKEYEETEFYEKFGKNYAISALAVIVEDGGGKFRVIHDATHKTCVNHRIRCRDKLRFPGVREKHQLMRERRDRGEIVLSLLGDFTKAHRWVRICDEEHGFLACQLEPGFIWVNRCGTFGVGSAAYWWARLSGCLVRAVHGLLGRKWAIEMLLFADDLELEAANHTEREAVVFAIYLFKILGAPFKNKKFRGGFSVEWIGLFMCNRSYAMGVSEKRANWLIKWMTTMLEEGTVGTMVFAGGLGRLNFAASALYHERPWLGPLYAWISGVIREGSPRATIPWGVRFILKWLIQRFREAGRVMVVPELPTERGELFRSDAKAENGRAFVGGWDLSRGSDPKRARWWYLEVTKEEFPWAYAKENDPNRVIATLELLGTILSLMIFDYSEETLKKGRCTITGETDNQGITLAMRKFMSTKWPLSALLVEMSEQLRARNIELHLDWLPREKNQEADDITNQNFSAFSPENEIKVVPKELPWIVLHDALEWAKDIYEITEKQKKKRTAGHFLRPDLWKKRKTAAADRLRTKDPW